MKLSLLYLLFLSLSFTTYAQSIFGKVLDSVQGKPLEYANIGIVNTSFGTVTDEMGEFKFEVNELESTAIVRISMIGYKSQTFTIEEIINKEIIITLVETPIELGEVVIRPLNNERKIGAKAYNLNAGWSGWGGLYVRKGFEMGTKIELGEQLVKIKSLHVYIHRQAFDTSLVRLHIRSMKDSIVQDELLTSNIILPISKESGWVDIDLENYDLYFNGDIALTLEWLKVIGQNKDRKMKVNKLDTDAYILFKNSKKHIGLYRWGTEANWVYNYKKSPSIYLTIKE